MDDDDQTNTPEQAPASVMGSLLASGFPFQTAIAALIPMIPVTPPWFVLQQEFPWHDETDSSRFLDLVIRRDPFSIVAIECKKTQKETYAFLQPYGVKDNVLRSRCLQLQRPLSTEPMDLYCSEWEISPASVEAMFCVVSSSKGGDSRLLEGDARLLIGGADAFALHYQRANHEDSQFDRFVLPVIVTNAKLFVARYNPREVSLETGQLDPSRTTTVPVDSVRFRKAFTGMDAGERTVFVVSASALTTWLMSLELVRWAAIEGSTVRYRPWSRP